MKTLHNDVSLLEKIMDNREDNGPSDKAEELVFDLWLKRGLNRLFKDIASEPVPEELIKIIKEGKKD